MKNDRKKEIFEAYKDEMDKDTFSFDDLMSRKDKKKKKKQQKFEDMLLRELEIKKEKKKQKELEETKKIEVKKIKEAVKENKRSEKEIGSNVINASAKKVSHNNIENSNIYSSKKEINKFTRFFLTITVIGILAFWIFSAIISFEKVNHIYMLISTSLISIGCLLLVLAGLMTRSKPRSSSNIIGASCLLSFAIINGLVLANIITFPTQPVLKDFTNKSINVAVKWANDNKVNLSPKYEYSDSTKENFVITQSERGEILAKNIKELEVIVSKGPNYELESNIPDMTGWHVDRVVKKLKEMKLDLKKINIEYNFSDEKKDTLYEQSKSGRMKRNEELTIKFSLGKEEDLKPVNLIDLRNKDKFDAIVWLKRNGIKYEIEYKFDNTISKGKVINTDPKDGTIIKQNETTVKIYISKGAKIVAPDFTKMSLEEIIAWASDNDISLNYESEFNVTIKAGNVVRVSASKGSIIEEGATITVVTSKGALKMISFGDDLNKLRSFAEKNNIALVEKQEFNKDVAQGKIISVSHKAGQVINTGESIEVVISKGSSIKVPNFIGMTESNAKKICSNLGLDCTISYVYSTKENGTVVDQNKSVDSELSKDSNIVLSISKGKSPASSGGGGNTGSGGGSTGGGSTGGGGNPQPPSCDRNNTVQVWLQVGNSFSDTKSMLLSGTSGIKWNIVAVNPGYGNSGDFSESSSNSYDGKYLNYCDTYTIEIISR